MLKYLFVIFAIPLMAASLKDQSTMSRISLKHREHSGVGYETGYSSGDLFLAPIWRHEFLPFMDLRFHVMNDGRFAFNGGLGLRTPFSDDWVFGLNAYYDYRSAENLSPSQIGVGFEALGTLFDVRLNGYAPFSNDEFFARHPVTISGQTASFKEEAEAALPVINGEVGVPFFERCSNFFLYGALGPYYLFQRKEHGFTFGGSWGGEARVSVTLSKILQVEGLVTYDKIFHTTVQGVIALRIPLGPRNLGAKDSREVLCSAMTQSVVRNEIIPIQDPERTVPLLHPETGQPVHLVIASQNLEQTEKQSKPGDVIYVPCKNYSGQLKLKPNQILQSSSMPFIGKNHVLLPTALSKLPKIQGVTLADNTQVIGFDIESATLSGKNNILALSQIGRVTGEAESLIMQAVQISNGINVSSKTQAKLQIINCVIQKSSDFKSQGALQLLLKNNQLDDVDIHLSTTSQRCELVAMDNKMKSASIETNTQLVYEWKNNTIDPTIVTIGKGTAHNAAPQSERAD